jgi:pyrimidine deaminase RibD-like protein
MSKIIDILYKKQTFYIGRNGAGKQIGLGFTDCGQFIALEPINSKHHIANCIMHIPKAQLPEIIIALLDQWKSALIKTETQEESAIDKYMQKFDVPQK